MYQSVSRKSLSKFALGGLIILGLAACDQREERINRAQDLGQAVYKQLNGETTAPTGQQRLAAVSVEARAFAGELQSSTPSPAAANQAPRFVIGSIVAKPRNLPPPIHVAAVVAEPETAFDVVVDDEAEAKIVIPDAQTLEAAETNPALIERLEKPVSKKRSVVVLDPRIQTAPRSIQTGGPTLPRAPLKEEIKKRRIAQGELPPEPLRPELRTPETAEMRIQQLPKLTPRLAERAQTMRTEALQKQLQAEDRMIETAEKYKLAASVQRSRSGQMVIEIGSNALRPTSLPRSFMQQSSMAYEEEDLHCNQVRARASNEDPRAAMQCVIEDLEASGEFEYVEKDYVFEPQLMRRPPGLSASTIQPNDPLFQYQWNFANQGSGPSDSEGGAGFVDFWTDKDTQGSREVVVAVIDTGLQMSHPDIQNSDNVMPGWDMVSDPDVGNDGDSRDSNPDDPGDICPERGVFANSYHGTHVAGIVGAGATNNQDGVAGGAWDVRIVPVRALGKCGGRLSDINDAIRWAAGTIPEYDTLGNEVWNQHPAHIINLSIGLFRSCPASMQDAINAVTAEGVIVVAAAGNDRVATDFYAPAGCQNVVTVAGGDARGHLAPYSNYGDAVDILAPGGDLTRDDNGDGNPDGILSTKSAENCADPMTGNSVSTCYYAYEQGTSMATPHVSAALALIKAKRPEMTADALVSTLLSGVSYLQPDQCTGSCDLYPGAEPSADDPDICLRPCGQGLLNLAEIDLPD